MLVSCVAWTATRLTDNSKASGETRYDFARLRLGRQGEFWRKYSLDAKFFDPEGEQTCREMIVQDMKKYRTCEMIMQAIGHTQVNIVCSKGVGNWYDNGTNTVDPARCLSSGASGRIRG